MESATKKWTRIATDISNAGFSTHYRGPTACKDKWQTLFEDYKKISDYKAATRSTEDYFYMASKRRKELTLPSKFCSSHFRKMEKFLNQRPCLNPPRQEDSFNDEDDDFRTSEELARLCAQQHITEEMLAGAEVSGDPPLHPAAAPIGLGGNAGPGLPQKPPTSSSHVVKRKEKLENAAHNLAQDPRPTNTAIRRRQTSSQSNMVEVTKTQGKDTVMNMQKLGDMEECKVVAAAKIAEKQLEYFKLRDSEISNTQRGLVQVINGLSQAIVHAYSFRGTPAPQTQSPLASGDDATFRPLNRSPPPSPAVRSHWIPISGASNDSQSARDVPVRDPLEWNIAMEVDGPEGLDIPAEDSNGHINVNTNDLT
jgi:hypothetical protein